MSVDDDISNKLSVLSSELRANTSVTQAINTQLAVHAKDHERIDQHIIDVKRVLFTGTEKEPSLVSEAVRNQIFRDQVATAKLSFVQWSGVVGSIVAGLAAIALVIVELAKGHHP